MNSKPILAALGAVVLWSSIAALSLRLRGVPPLFLTGSALVIGGAISVWRARRDWAKDKTFLLVGAGAIFLYHWFLFMALRMAPPVECNMINYLWPLLLVLLAPLFDRRIHWSGLHLIGAVLGFCGAILVMAHQPGVPAAHGGFSWGYLLALAAAVIWSTYSLFLRRFPEVSSWAMGQVCLLSGVISLASACWVEEWAPLKAPEFGWLIFFGLGPLGASFYLWDYAMKRANPQRIGSLAYLTPILSTTWLARLTGQKLDATIIVALAMVIGGAVLSSRAKERAATGQPTQP